MTGNQPVDAYAEIRAQVIQSMNDNHLEPDAESEALYALIEEAVNGYQETAYKSGGKLQTLADPKEMIRRIHSAITKFGPFTHLIERKDIVEVFIEQHMVSYKNTDGHIETLTEPVTAEQARQFVQSLLAETEGKRLDASSMHVSTRVLGGRARLTALTEPITDKGISATLRFYTMKQTSLRQMVAYDSLDVAAASFLKLIMRARTPRVAVSGAIGAGKTTMLSCLIKSLPNERIVRVCEDTRELNQPLGVGSSYWEAQEPPPGDPTGGVPLRDLVKIALRMAADVIVIGEVRGSETFELTRAMNAGAGFLVSCHSNDAKSALTALVTMAMQAGENVREDSMRSMFAHALDYVVHVDVEDIASKDGDTARRQTMEIAAVTPGTSDSTFTLQPIFKRNNIGDSFEWTGYVPDDERLQRALPAGVDLRNVLTGSYSLL